MNQRNIRLLRVDYLEAVKWNLIVELLYCFVYETKRLLMVVVNDTLTYFVHLKVFTIKNSRNFCIYKELRKV